MLQSPEASTLNRPAMHNEQLRSEAVTRSSQQMLHLHNCALSITPLHTGYIPAEKNPVSSLDKLFIHEKPSQLFFTISITFGIPHFTAASYQCSHFWVWNKLAGTFVSYALLQSIDAMGHGSWSRHGFFPPRSTGHVAVFTAVILKRAGSRGTAG